MITVSLVLYKNDPNEIKELLNSIISSKSDIKIFLIDNSPTDPLKILNEIHLNINYIFNNKNLGFGAAHNMAIKESIIIPSKYHLIINPDIQLNKDVLEELTIYMDNNEDVGLVMPKILFPDGQIQYLCKLLPNPFNLIFRRFIPKNLIKKYNYKFELRQSGYNKIMNVPYLSGAFMFIRTKVLEDVGYFDENFFMYCEDIDLSRRIHRKYKTIFYPNVVVFHHHEKGSYKSLRLLKYHIRSAIYYFNKWGWFFDKERNALNKATLNEILKLNMSDKT